MMTSKNKYIGVLLLACLAEEEERCLPNEVVRRKPRSVWVREWVQKRQQEGFCEKLFKELRDENPSLYRNFVQMTHDQFERLRVLVTPLIQRQNTKLRQCIPAADRLALTLRYLATGESFRSLQYLFRIPQVTITSIVPEVLDAIYSVLMNEYIKTPSTAEAWECIAQRYSELWNYPYCIGAVDAKHIVMGAPSNVGSVLYNYKGAHSIILMGIADADYKLIYVDVAGNGRSSDGCVFNRSSFAQSMDNGKLELPAAKPLPGREMPVPYVLIADNRLALHPNVITPYNNNSLSMVERVYNDRLNKARNVIENVFGIMSTRFRILRKAIPLDTDKTKKITLACCALHNYLITTNRQKYAPPESFDRFNVDGSIIPAEWRREEVYSTFYPLESPLSSEITNNDIQKEFAEYFVNQGKLE